MVSHTAMACPNCGRPYPTRKRTSQGTQVGMVVLTLCIGGMFGLLGIMMMTLSRDSGSQAAGGTFFLLGLSVVMIGFVLLAFVLGRRDW